MSAVVDPVCGMTIDKLDAKAGYIHEGTMYYFCRTWCWEQFAKHPEHFIGGNRPNAEAIPRVQSRGRRPPSSSTAHRRGNPSGGDGEEHG